MMTTSPNRLDPLAMTVSVPRQTPRNEFGTVLANTLGDTLQSGVGLLGGIAGFHPVATAAVSTLGAATKGAGNHALLAGLPAANSAGIPPSTANGSTAPSSYGLSQDSIPDLLGMISAGGSTSSAAFLELQMRMQQESEHFSAVSNVLKVRSDSAKAAINNIR